jgi:signal transduction histidine kinase
MKSSLRLKITSLLTFLIVVTIFLTWFINGTFLDDYYLYSKMKTLNEVYVKVRDIYEKSDNLVALSEEEILQIDRLASVNNVSIYVNVWFGDGLVMSYPSHQTVGNRELSKNKSILFEYQFGVSRKEILQDTDDYGIYRLYDSNDEVNYIDLFGSIGKDKIIIARSNFDDIQESVMIANKFLAYIGSIAVVLGIIMMLLISKRFTKPILDLAGIAKRMSELDFDVKYQVKSKDEIGVLGNSINTLSERLQNTILELKQANNELLTDIQQKSEIDEMRKEFLSNVTHELKTPLALIQGYAEGLKENINEDEESRNFYCDVIIDEADKMNQMVKKLLSLNELEFGKNIVSFERFDIVALIHSVIGASEILLKQKGIRIYFEASEPVYVWSDEYLVEQVVSNYISNAINHVKGSNIIEIKLIQREDVVRVAVYNTGDNIPEEELDKLWIKFYKVDKARTREYGGSGIGLSIVKAIMNSLNRDCGVINRPQGVEFWFEVDTKI